LPRPRKREAHAALQTRLMEVSLAYFLYDFLVCLCIDPEPVGALHHVCTVAGLVVGLLRGKARLCLPTGVACAHCRPQCGCELVGCLLLMELSNPSMHLNQLLKELRLQDTQFALANQVLFALLFFVCRLLLGPLVVYTTLASPTTPLLIKAGGAGILLVSLVWFRKARWAGRWAGVCIDPPLLPCADCPGHPAQGTKDEDCDEEGMTRASQRG